MVTVVRWLVGAMGMALLVGATFGGSLAVGDRFDPSHLAALVIGLAALGIALAGKRVFAAYGSGAVLVMNTVLLLAGVELGAALFLGRTSSQAATPLPGESSPYYREKPWATAYWREFHAIRHAYHPYFLWRARPFRGHLINVDSSGLRATPGAQCAGGAYEVAAFGGSTLWGWGEPDSATLGAQIQDALAGASATPVCVRNFAQLGSNSTQDLIQLLRELQAGRIPDLVIFYNGVNEIIPPYGYGEAGAHFDFRGVATRLEGALDDSQRARQSLRTWVAGSSLWRLVSKSSSGGRHAGRPGRGPAGAGGPFTSQGLADSIVSTFMTNFVALDAIAASYGFRYEVFWQPNALVGRKPLTPEELAMRGKEKIAPLVELVYSRMSCLAARYEHLHDLSDVFAGDSALVYLDWNHVNSAGNRVIAGAISRAALPAGKPGSSPGRASPVAPPRANDCVSHPSAAKASQANGQPAVTRQP
jgi:lysophospholipase L1-like esterase